MSWVERWTAGSRIWLVTAASVLLAAAWIGSSSMSLSAAKQSRERSVEAWSRAQQQEVEPVGGADSVAGSADQELPALRGATAAAWLVESVAAVGAALEAIESDATGVGGGAGVTLRGRATPPQLELLLDRIHSAGERGVRVTQLQLVGAQGQFVLVVEFGMGGAR